MHGPMAQTKKPRGPQEDTGPRGHAGEGILGFPHYQTILYGVRVSPLPDLCITPRFPPRPPAAGDTEGWDHGKASRLLPLLGPSPSPQCPSQKSCVLSACCGGFDRSRAQAQRAQGSKELPL